MTSLACSHAVGAPGVERNLLDALEGATGELGRRDAGARIGTFSFTFPPEHICRAHECKLAFMIEGGLQAAFRPRKGGYLLCSPVAAA